MLCVNIGLMPHWWNLQERNWERRESWCFPRRSQQGKHHYLRKNITNSFSEGDLTLRSPHVRESMTVLDSGLHPLDSGFRVLDSGFQLSRFRIPKRAGFQFFSALMLFFAFRFRVRILLYWKTLFRMHNKFVFFFDL